MSYSGSSLPSSSAVGGTQGPEGLLPPVSRSSRPRALRLGALAGVEGAVLMMFYQRLMKADAAVTGKMKKDGVAHKTRGMSMPKPGLFTNEGRT